MGVFEFEKFAVGTDAIAKKLAELTGKGVTTIIGGGDSVAAVEKAGLADKMSHISAGVVPAWSSWKESLSQEFLLWMMHEFPVPFKAILLCSTECPFLLLEFGRVDAKCLLKDDLSDVVDTLFNKGLFPARLSNCRKWSCPKTFYFIVRVQVVSATINFGS